ncbi:MAG: 7-cyano-7-deazaguanine synthase QueC [Candidatus Omnitrophica bacterium]|nr:7-cyano-7-deazaguanine synthase QueC [Candidatus Omnitrophota bacterium]
MPKRAIVLLSGGIDSATCLYVAKKEKFLPHCLIFDYGQKHKREIESAKKLARKAGVGFSICKTYFPWKGSSLIDPRIKIPKRGRGIPSTYVPARNMIFLSFALSCAEAMGAKAVFIGANAVDFSGYPDCRPDFYRAFSAALKKGLKNKNISIKTPLIRKKKSEIIILGKSLGVPYELTWSCYRGGMAPCRVCDSCRFRAKGFREAGFEDPLV